MKYNEKMSELLGILKSINYDEVINELEIESLKKWIETNENNSDPRFQEIINKLKKILENKIIAESEKKDIIKITEQYYDLGKSVNGLNELIGIIEGIISDNKINIAEVNNLQKWLNNNLQLSHTFFYDRISMIVKEVLKDGILDDEEKQKLKVLLNFLLKDNNLNQRVEVLKKKVKNNEIIGNQLIELIDDDTIISKIHKEAIQQLNILLNRKCSVFDVDSEIIFISLTLIALLNYDSNYYDYVADTYATLYEKYNEQRIEGQIRNVISKYKNNDDEHRIISSVLKNAIVPKYFLPSFFEFIYDIYRLNFDFSIDPNSDLYEEFSFVYDGIKKGLNFEDDTLNLKVTNKTYSLIKTTKDLILNDTQINELIKLSVSILKIIDNYYWSNLNPEFENEYYSYGFDTWKGRLDKAIQESKNRNSEFKSRWEPELKLNGKKIYLSIPNHKIKNFYNFEDLKIEISNDDNLIYVNDQLNIYDIIGGYRIENDDVLIENPLGKLRYKLTCDNDVIYDSKEKLYRNYIFFNESGNELKNNRDYEGIAVLCNYEELDNIQIMSRCDNYILGYISVKVGDYFKINDEMFNFTTIHTPGIIGKEKLGKCIKNSKEMTIYEEVEGIVYESEKNVDKIALVINGTRHKLNEFEIESKKRGLYNNYFIKLQLEKSIYTINFEEYTDEKYSTSKQFMFLLDNGFDYNLEKIDENEYLVEINYLKNKLNKSINYEIDNINKIDFENQNISFIIPLKIPLFKVDQNSWKEILGNYIWIKDINTYSNLRINGFDFSKAVVNDENGNLLTTLYPSTEKYYYDLSIGTLKSYESQKYITIDFYNNDKKIGFVYCYCQCVLNKKMTTFWYDRLESKYNGIISYYGKGNIIVKVFDEHKNAIFEKKVENNETITIEYLKSFKNYNLQVIDKKTGFTLESDKVIYEDTLKYYSLPDFIGRYFQIYLVNYDQLIGKIFTRKSKLLYNTYIEITEQVSDYEFIGNIYIHRGEKKYLDKINPVEIEFTSDINEGQIEASITKDGDGLFNDFERHSILNQTESKTAIDIFSYVINMERKR